MHWSPPSSHLASVLASHGRAAAVACLLIAPILPGLGPTAVASQTLQGADVKVTNDNGNVPATPSPGFDGANLPSFTTTVAINPVAPNIVAAGATDFRLLGAAWVGLYVSSDAGRTWFNTMVPGQLADRSPAGLASPLHGLDTAATPTVRFDAGGHLFVAGEAYNSWFRRAQEPPDVVVFVAKYRYTPGTPPGPGTPTSPVNPPNYTYERTTIIDRGSVGFATPGAVGFSGSFTDTVRIAIDRNPLVASACAGFIYETHAIIHSHAGSEPTVFSRSTDDGVTFSAPRTISTSGLRGTTRTATPRIAVASDGTIYVVYHAIHQSSGAHSIDMVKSTDCGAHWSQPVVVAEGLLGLCFPDVTVDDEDVNIVYVSYWDSDGDFDVYVHRSLDAGLTWGPRVQVNTDPGQHDQVFPTIGVSHGTLHVAWYDFRHSAAGENDEVDVYYTCSNCNGHQYPSFAAETRVTDVSSNSECLLFGAFASLGVYIELAARWNGVDSIVHLAWADNRDITPCRLVSAPGPFDTGVNNQNIYADTLIVGP